MKPKKKRVIPKLQPNSEIIGTLIGIEEHNNCSKLQFSCYKEIELPKTAIPQNKLISLVGKRVGIFFCNERYFFRVVKGVK